MIDYSNETAVWDLKIRDIKDALRDRKYATALSRIAEMQASLISVDMWVQERLDSRIIEERKLHAVEIAIQTGENHETA